MKNVLFTHTDLDGAGCEIVYRLTHNDYDTIIVSSEIKNIDENVMKTVEGLEHSHITFSDICASNETLQALVDAGHSIEIYDHHPTNMKCKEVIPSAVVIPERDGKMECGTSLLYQHYRMIADMYESDTFKIDGYGLDSMSYILKGLLKANSLPLFVDTVRSYDTYEFKKTGNNLAKELNILFYMIGYKRFVDKYVKYMAGWHTEIIDEPSKDFIQAKIDMEMDTIRSFHMSDIYQFDIKGWKCGLIFGTKGANISEFGYNFLNAHRDELDILILADLQLGVYQVRTVKEGIDLGKDICAPIGGGGHPMAAGATIDKTMLDAIKYNVAVHLKSNIEITV